MAAPDTKVHLGSKIKRIREIKGIKQEALAIMLGENQQAISRLEQSEYIEDSKLQKVADALEVPLEALKNFNEEAVINNISCIFNDNAYQLYQFNPIEKIVELYERMLQLERERNTLLEEKLREKEKPVRAKT